VLVVGRTRRCAGSFDELTNTRRAEQHELERNELVVCAPGAPKDSNTRASTRQCIACGVRHAGARSGVTFTNAPARCELKRLLADLPEESPL
jgi:hypothetical protein